MFFHKGSILLQAALLLSCFFVYSCENDQAEVDKLFRRKTAVEEAFQVESYLSQDAKVRAKLTAPYMKRSLADSPYIEFPKTLHVDFYNDSLIIESTLDARYAKQMEFEHKVLLRDSVVVINKLKGDTLRTSELWWDQNTEMFYTTKLVQIFQRNGYQEGREGLTAKQDFSEWWLRGSSGRRLVANDSVPF